jgi:hypothetical protein
MTTTSNGNRRVGGNSKFDISKARDLSVSIDKDIKRIRSENQYQFSGRVDDEKLLEDYLISLGFEVLIPETYSSYQDQLNEIASARILASITSSALFSSLVLPPESKVVEFCTMVHLSLNQSGELDITHGWFPEHYRFISLMQRNIYIPIPNTTLKAEDIISYIESKPEIKALLL